MASRGRIYDDLKTKSYEISKGVTPDELASMPIGTTYAPTKKATERPFLEPGETLEDRNKKSKVFDDAMARYIGIQAGKAKSGEQDAALKNLSRTLGYEDNAPLQYEDFFKRFRTDKDLQANEDAQQIAAIEIQKRTGYQLPNEKAAALFGQIIDFDDNQRQMLTPKVGANQTTSAFKGTYIDEQGNEQVVSFDRINNEQDVQRRQRKALATSKFGTPEAVLMGMDIDDDLAKAFLDPKLDAVNIPLYRTSDGAHAFDVNASRSKLSNHYYTEALNRATGVTGTISEQQREKIWEGAQKRADEKINQVMQNNLGVFFVDADPQGKTKEIRENPWFLGDIPLVGGALATAMGPIRATIAGVQPMDASFNNVRTTMEDQGLLDYIGSVSLGTSIGSAIHAGGWNTPEHIELIRRGYDITDDFGNIAKIFTPKFLEREAMRERRLAAQAKGYSAPLPDATFEVMAGIGPMIGLILIDPDPTLLLGPIGKGGKAIGKALGIGSTAIQAKRLESAQGLVKELAKMSDEQLENGGFVEWMQKTKGLDRDLYEVFNQRLLATQGLKSGTSESKILSHFGKKRQELAKSEDALKKAEKDLMKEGDTLAKKQKAARIKEARRQNAMIGAKIDAEEAAARLLASKKATLMARPDVLKIGEGRRARFITNDRQIADLLRPIAKEFDDKREALRRLQKERIKVQNAQQQLVQRSFSAPAAIAPGQRATSAVPAALAARQRAMNEIEKFFSSMDTIKQEAFLKNRSLYKNLANNQNLPDEFIQAMQTAFPNAKDSRAYLANKRKLVEIHNRINTSGGLSYKYFVTDKSMQPYNMSGTRIGGVQGKLRGVSSKDITDPAEPIVSKSNIGSSVFLSPVGFRQLDDWSRAITPTDVRVKPLQQTARIEGDEIVFSAKGRRDLRLPYGKRARKDDVLIDVLKKPLGSKNYVNNGIVKEITEQAGESLTTQLGRAIGAKGFIQNYDAAIKARGKYMNLAAGAGRNIDELKSLDKLIRENAEQIVKAGDAIKAVQEGREFLAARTIKGLAKEFDQSIDVIIPKILEAKTLRGKKSPLRGAIKRQGSKYLLNGDLLLKNVEDLFGKDAVATFLARGAENETVTGAEFAKLLKGGKQTITAQEVTALNKGISELTRRADTLVEDSAVLGQSLVNQMRDVYRTGLDKRNLRKKFNQEYPFKSFVLDLQDSLKKSIGFFPEKFLRGTTQTTRAAGYATNIADAYKTAIEVRGALTQDIDLLLSGVDAKDVASTITRYFGSTKAIEIKGANFPETYMNTGPISLFEQALRQAISNQSTINVLSTKVSAEGTKDALSTSFTKAMPRAEQIQAMEDITAKLAESKNDALKFVEMVLNNEVKGFSPQEKVILEAIKDKLPKGLTMRAADEMGPGVRGYYQFATNPRNNEVTPMGIFLRGMTDQTDEALSLAGVNPVTVVHELLHAATVQKMSDFLPMTREGRRVVKMSPEAKKAAGDIVALTKHLSRVFKSDELIARYASELTPREISLMKSNLRSQMALDREAGPYELITYALTSPEFQSILSKIKSADEIKGRPESLWTKFVSSMSKLLGLDKAGVKDSVLARVVDASDQLLTAKSATRPATQALDPKIAKTLETTEEGFNKTLRALSRVWIPRGIQVTPEDAAALGYKASQLAGELINRGSLDTEDMTLFMKKMRTFTKSILKRSYEDEGTLASTPEAYAFAKAALINGVTVDEASKVAVNTFGSMSDELVDDMNKILSGSFAKIGEDAEFDSARATKALNKLVELGIGTTTRQIKTDIGSAMEKTSQLIKMSEDASGQSGFVPLGLMSDIEALSGNIVKSLEIQTNIDKGGGAARTALFMKQFFNTFRASITTGLLLPNPRYWLNNVVGDFAQIWQEEGLLTASKLSFQNLPANLPFIGRPMQNAMFKASASLQGTPVLGPAMNALFNPALHKVWSGSADEVVKMRDGTSYTVGELRRMLASDGAMDTFVQETLIEGLRDRTRNAMEQYGAAKGISKTKIAELYKRSNNAIQKHATFVQQRQRAGLYLEYLNRGFSREDAKTGMMNALYDWKRPLGQIETNYLANIFTFWRFQRLATEQFGRNLVLGMTQGGPSRRIMGLPMPSRGKGARALGRIREMEQILDTVPAAMYHAEGAGEEGQAKTYDDVLDAFYRDIPFWWQGSRATAYSMPIMNKEVKEWYEKRGYDFTYQDWVIPPFTPLDMANQYLGAATWVYGMGMAGVGLKQATPDATSQLVIDPLAAVLSPGLSTAFEGAMKNLSGGTQYIGGGRTYLRTQEAEALKNLYYLDTIKRDDNGRPYLDGNSRMFAILLRSMPFFGTQLSQYYAAVDNPAWVQGVGPGTNFMLQKLLGVAARPKSPERELKYPVKEREQDLSKEVRSVKDRTQEQFYRVKNQ